MFTNSLQTILCTWNSSDLAETRLIEGQGLHYTDTFY